MSRTAVHIDFETRSKTDLKKLGLMPYACCPSTEVLCLAWSYRGEEEIYVENFSGGVPAELSPEFQLLMEDVSKGVTVIAWNAAFEFEIWNRVFIPQLQKGYLYYVPPLTLEQMLDAMAIAAMCHLPQSLKTCGEVLGLKKGEAKDAKRGEYLIRKLGKPRKNGGFFEDDDLTQELLIYCKQDVKAEKTITEKLPKMTEAQQAVWVMTQKINQRGVPFNKKFCEDMSYFCDEYKKYLNAELKKITSGQVSSAQQHAKMLEYIWDTFEQNLHNLQAKTVADTLKDDELPPRMRTILQIRQSASLTSVSKFKKIIQLLGDDFGRVYYLLNYHGASTGRYSSKGGINVQNLARTEEDMDLLSAMQLFKDTNETRDYEFASLLYEDPLKLASKCVRASIQAPEGKTFFIADYTGIENRVAAWLSDEKEVLENFKNGLDEYKLFAVDMYNVAYDDVTKAQRQVGKAACLGAQFGQGGKGFVRYAEKYGVILTEEEADHIIKLYRQKRKKMVALWYACSDAAMLAIQEPGTITHAGRYLRFKADGNFLMALLPSNRIIRFFKPEIKDVKTPWGDIRPGIIYYGKNQKNQKWEDINLIGSSIFQSAVQGLASDIPIRAMTQLENADYEVVFQVHDEVIVEIDELREDKFEEFIALMTAQPSWALTLPLAVKGFIDRIYSK